MESNVNRCWKCENVFKNKQGLSKHQNKCLLKRPEGASFFKDERIILNSHRSKNKANEEKFDKILPPSQLLDMESEQLSNHTPTRVETNQSEAKDENSNCSICKVLATGDTNYISCTMCNTRVHQACLHMDDEEYRLLSQSDAVWFCARCRQKL